MSEDQIKLHGLRVLVTRPMAQAGPLIKLIKSAGGKAVPLPVLAIEPPVSLSAAKRQLAGLQDFQILIFTSVNAVDGLFDICSEPRFAQGVRVFAVGAATADALARRGIVAEQPPAAERSSEGLLRLSGLQAQAVHQRPVLIVKGEGGRDLLRQELDVRGAQVTSVEVYRRAVADLTADCITASGCHVMIASSETVLKALHQRLDQRQRTVLLSLGVVAISERVARAARELGFSGRVVVAPAASDEGLLTALNDWRCGG
jgi:uroporphyrinogen-III synthase